MKKNVQAKKTWCLKAVIFVINNMHEQQMQVNVKAHITSLGSTPAINPKQKKKAIKSKLVR